MVKYAKYETKTGKEKWRYYGHEGVDEKTGEKIKVRGQGFNSRAEAKINYERKLEELNKNKSQQKTKRLKFKELYSEFLVYYRESGVAPGTIKKFNDETSRHILPYIGDIYIDKLDVNDCQNLYNKVRESRKDHQKIVNQADRIMDFAIARNYINTNPMKYILPSKSTTHYKKRRLSSSENFYEPEQLMRFLDAFKEVEEFHKFVYFRLIAFTGLRRGEALALYESDVIRSEKAIDVNKTLAEDENGRTYLKTFPKTSESMNLVYLDDATYDYVIELIKNRNSFERYGKMTYIHDNKFLFPSPKTQKFYGRSAPNDWLNRFFYRNGPELEKMGLFRISPHGFRHSQATLLFELGVDPKNAQYRLRHKNLKTTMDVYTHLTNRGKRAPITKLDDFSARGTTLGTTNLEEIKKEHQEH